MRRIWSGLGRSVLPPAVWLFSITRVGAEAPPDLAPVAAPSVTVPFFLDHNRMTVEVEFVRPDGVIRPARAWVDAGSEVLMLTAPLAAELGLGQQPASACGDSCSTPKRSPPRSNRGRSCWRGSAQRRRCLRAYCAATKLSSITRRRRSPSLAPER